MSEERRQGVSGERDERNVILANVADQREEKLYIFDVLLLKLNYLATATALLTDNSQKPLNVFVTATLTAC